MNAVRTDDHHAFTWFDKVTSFHKQILTVRQLGLRDCLRHQRNGSHTQFATNGGSRVDATVATSGLRQW